MEIVPGVVVSGRMRRPGRAGRDVSIEVHAIVAIPDQAGAKHPYLFGVRMDAGQAGRVQAIRLGRIRVRDVAESAGYKQLDLSKWYVNTSGQFESVGFVDELTDPADKPFFEAVNAKPLADFVVDPS